MKVIIVSDRDVANDSISIIEMPMNAHGRSEIDGRHVTVSACQLPDSDGLGNPMTSSKVQPIMYAPPDWPRRTSLREH